MGEALTLLLPYTYLDCAHLLFLPDSSLRTSPSSYENKQPTNPKNQKTSPQWLPIGCNERPVLYLTFTSLPPPTQLLIYSSYTATLSVPEACSCPYVLEPTTAPHLCASGCSSFQPQLEEASPDLCL